MLEIDGVHIGLQHTPWFDQADRLADSYVGAVDMITAPHVSEGQRTRVQQITATLDQNNGFILNVLSRAESFPEMEDVTRAYSSALNQIKELAREA